MPAARLKTPDIYDYIRPRICQVNGVKKGTGFFVNQSGLLVTTMHSVGIFNKAIHQLGTQSSTTEIDVHYRGATYKADILFPAYPISAAEDYDYCFIQIRGEIETPCFQDFLTADNVRHGETVYFGGYPLSLDHETLHKGTLSSIGLARFGRLELTMDATVVMGFSGGPLIVQHYDSETSTPRLYVIGIITSEVTDFAAGFRKAHEFIDAFKKTGGTSGITRTLVSSTPDGLQVIRTLNDLDALAEIINGLERNISTGVGTAVAIDYLLHGETVIQEPAATDTLDTIEVGRKRLQRPTTRPEPTLPPPLPEPKPCNPCSRRLAESILDTYLPYKLAHLFGKRVAEITPETPFCFDPRLAPSEGILHDALRAMGRADERHLRIDLHAPFDAMTPTAPIRVAPLRVEWGTGSHGLGGVYAGINIQTGVAFAYRELRFFLAKSFEQQNVLTYFKC